MDDEFDYRVSAEQKGQRLDQLLPSLAGLNLSRSQAKKLIEQKRVLVNHEPSRPSYKIKFADRIQVAIAPAKNIEVRGENIPLDIVYEDEDIIVVNKPKAMVVHPAPGNYHHTLVNALLFHCQLASLGSPLRPGIVHRLDKDTSGLLAVAKNDFSYHSLAKQIKNRTVEKTYIALVHGGIKNDAGTISARLGRHPVQRKKMAAIEGRGAKGERRSLPVGRRGTKTREAITDYKVLQRFKKYTLVEIKIKTGRTHQIRVHLSHLGNPIVGDQTYGKKREEFATTGQLLHARKLGFVHPRTQKYLEFETSPPAEMQRIIQEVSGNHVAGKQADHQGNPHHHQKFFKSDAQVEEANR
jgi:23S rRNA pseudouridine1911/1915/1917 synthase